MTPTVITSNVNAVSPVVMHRARKLSAVSSLISHHNDAGYNEMVTIELAPGYYFADGSTTFDAHSTEEFIAAIAGITTTPAETDVMIWGFTATSDDDVAQDADYATRRHIRRSLMEQFEVNGE